MTRDRLLASVRGVSSTVVGFGVFAALFTASGCGSGSASAQSRSQANVPAERRGAVEGPSIVDGVSARSVDRALLAVRDPPRPMAVTCRVSSSAERRVAPFGRTRLPLFTCEMTLTGERASYAVQVLHNGCFVAERRRPGRAVYGCGVDRS